MKIELTPEEITLCIDALRDSVFLSRKNTAEALIRKRILWMRLETFEQT